MLTISNFQSYEKVEKPLVTVVVPTYNSAKFIEDTLTSVFNQSFTNYEVIVSDDGSEDNTVEVVKTVFQKRNPKKAKILKNIHKGPGSTRNTGIEAASGTWISFLDSDDQWLPDKLEKVFSYIETDNDLDLVCHSEIWKNSNEDIVLKYYNMFDNRVSPFLSLFRNNSLSTSAVTVRKELLLKAGLFDCTLPAAQDYDLWLRLSLLNRFRIGFIKSPLGSYVTREGNISSNPKRKLDCLLRISEKYFKDLREKSNLSYIERRKFEGKAYGAAGLDLIRKKDLKDGMSCIAVSFFKWPFRLDWIRKIL